MGKTWFKLSKPRLIFSLIPSLVLFLLFVPIQMGIIFLLPDLLLEYSGFILLGPFYLLGYASQPFQGFLEKLDLWTVSIISGPTTGGIFLLLAIYSILFYALFPLFMVTISFFTAIFKKLSEPLSEVLPSYFKEWATSPHRVVITIFLSIAAYFIAYVFSLMLSKTLLVELSKATGFFLLVLAVILLIWQKWRKYMEAWSRG